MVIRFVLTLAVSSLLVTMASGAASAQGTASTGTAMRAGSATRYTSLGDSYTAGPLIPDLTGDPAGCARSTSNYPSRVAAAIHAASFTDVSCQGAPNGLVRLSSVQLMTMLMKLMSLPPIWSVTRVVLDDSPLSCGGLLPSGTDSLWVMLVVSAPWQLTSVKDAALVAAATSDG